MNIQNLLEVVNFKPESHKFPHSWCGHLPFASWIIRELNPKNFVELGTHTGNSYLSFCQIVKQHKLQTKCFAVDHWKGDEHAGLYNTNIYDDLKAYHDPLYKDFSKLLKKSFDEALDEFEDGTIDLLHIDGFHTYEAVKHDFETWLPKLTSNAIVLLHDTEVRERNFGVWKYWDEICKKYPNNINFNHSNGLGVVQLSTNSEACEWIKPKSVEKEQIYNYFSSLGENIMHSCNDNTLSDIRHHPHFIEAQEVIDSLNRKIESIYISHSWKITRPLRFLRRTIHISTIRSVIWGIRRFLLQFKGFRFLEGLVKHFLTLKLFKSSNLIAHNEIVSYRNNITENLDRNFLEIKLPKDLPEIDINIVTYNSQKWVGQFVNSLLNVDYPAKKLNLFFVDNNSEDQTIKTIESYRNQLEKQGFSISIFSQKSNSGFGSGHNFAAKQGKAEYFIVSNIDLEYTKNSLKSIVTAALADPARIVAWEFRQKPYEHPKFYDPVTGITTWNSHACVMIRRSAFKKVKGYDENIFMYGEDVDLSYNFREHGFLIRYCPNAVVMHYSYETKNQVKPLQYVGSIFANAYLRIKYGSFIQAITSTMIMAGLLIQPEPFKGARKELFAIFLKLSKLLPQIVLLRLRRGSKVAHPFRFFDYEMSRKGEFLEYKNDDLEDSLPLISVITRTFKGREMFLKQAILSVAHQTYPNIEHIVVEDGGKNHEVMVKEVAKITGSKIKYLSIKKSGRSTAGNRGLEQAKGKYCLFLDDDDLLFCDHVETLYNELTKNQDCVAVYSDAIEVKTKTKTKNNKLIYCNEFVEEPMKSFALSFDRKLLQERNYITIQSILFEKQLFESRGGFDEDIDFLEDWILWNKYAKGNKFHYVEKFTSMYRVPHNFLSAENRKNNFLKAYKEAQNRIKDYSNKK